TELELHGLLLRNDHPLERLWILCSPRGAVLDLKHAEIAELKPVAVTQFLDHLVEELLEHVADIQPLQARLHGDPVDEFLLSYCRNCSNFPSRLPSEPPA